MTTSVTAKALFSCTADDPETELSFKAGDILLDVVETVETGWAEGRLEGTTTRGLFPLNFVEVMQAPEKPKKATQPPRLPSRPGSVVVTPAGSPKLPSRSLANTVSLAAGPVPPPLAPKPSCEFGSGQSSKSSVTSKPTSTTNPFSQAAVPTKPLEKADTSPTLSVRALRASLESATENQVEARRASIARSPSWYLNKDNQAEPQRPPSPTHSAPNAPPALRPQSQHVPLDHPIPQKPSLPKRPSSIASSIVAPPPLPVRSNSQPLKPEPPVVSNGATIPARYQAPPLPTRKPTPPVQLSNTPNVAALDSSAPTNPTSKMEFDVGGKVKTFAQDKSAQAASVGVTSAFSKGRKDLESSKYGSIAQKVPGKDRAWNYAENAAQKHAQEEARKNTAQAMDDPMGTLRTGMNACDVATSSTSSSSSPSVTRSTGIGAVASSFSQMPGPRPLASKKPNDTPSLPPPALPTRSRNSTTTKELSRIPAEARERYRIVFEENDEERSGQLSGSKVREIFIRSGLDSSTLKQVWTLSDANGDGKLSQEEFFVGMFLIDERLRGIPIPETLPPGL